MSLWCKELMDYGLVIMIVPLLLKQKVQNKFESELALFRHRGFPQHSTLSKQRMRQTRLHFHISLEEREKKTTM